MTDQNAPPIDVAPGGDSGGQSTSIVVVRESTAAVRQSGAVPRCRAALAVWLHRRRLRLDCGCREVCYCTKPPFSEKALDGWRDAAEHLLASGQVPLVPLEVRRALWRRGDRELAELLHVACGEIAS